MLASTHSDAAAPYFLGSSVVPLPLSYALSYVFPEATQAFHDAVFEPIINARPSPTAAPSAKYMKMVLAFAPTPVTVLSLAALDIILAARYLLTQERTPPPPFTLRAAPSTHVSVCMVCAQFRHVRRRQSHDGARRCARDSLPPSLATLRGLPHALRWANPALPSCRLLSRASRALPKRLVPSGPLPLRSAGYVHQIPLLE